MAKSSESKSSESDADHLTDRVAKKADEILDDTSDVPGPSPNPATNLIISDIVLRSAGRLSRLAVEKALLGRRYGSQFARDAVENRSVVQTMAAYGVTKLATRSIPGALLVGGGLALKVLFDRSQSRRKAKRAGEKSLRDQAESDSPV